MPHPDDAFWTSTFIESNGLRLHVLRTPVPNRAGRPAIVLAHGVTDNARCFTTFAERLAPTFDVIAYDARGHGLSDKPATDYTPQTQAADLLGLLDALDLRRPILFGHSMGASTVAWFAARHPERVHALVLEDPVALHVHDPFRPLPPERAAAERVRLRAWSQELHRLPLTTLASYAQMQHPRWDPREYGYWAEAKQQVSPHVVDVMDGVAAQPITEAFPHIQAPTLILKADADGPHRTANEKAAARLPNAVLLHLRGAGHNVRRDTPAATLEALLAFVVNTL